MKTIEQIEAQLAELQVDLAALKAQPKEWPQIGDTYWAVCTDGVNEYCFDDDTTDADLFSQGNAFRTRKEAEAERDARAVVAELRKQPGRKKFVADEMNWHVAVVIGSDNVYFDWTFQYSAGFAQVYFDSEASVSSAIEAVGADRILKATRWWACGEC